MNKSYSELVAQAESAVSAVKDAELRRVAFEKILDDLLASSRSGDQTSATNKGGRGEETSGAGQKRTTTKVGKNESNTVRGGISAYVGELIEEDFFSKPKTISEVKAELGNRGHHIPLTSLSGPLQRLCQAKKLRRQKTSDGDGKKKAFAYSNW